MSIESRRLIGVLAIVGYTVRLGEFRQTQAAGGRHAGPSDSFALARR